MNGGVHFLAKWSVNLQVCKGEVPGGGVKDAFWALGSFLNPLPLDSRIICEIRN